jgi:hypothetical protein
MLTLNFFIALLVFVLAFAGGMYLLERDMRPLARVSLFIVLVLLWNVLTLSTMRLAHLLGGEIAVAWCAALLLWAVVRIGRTWFGSRRPRATTY